MADTQLQFSHWFAKSIRGYSFIRNDGGNHRKRTFGAKKGHWSEGRGRCIGNMASGASYRQRAFLPPDDGIDAPADKPESHASVVGRLHDGHPAAHQCVVRAAVCDKEVVTAGFVGRNHMVL